MAGLGETPGGDRIRISFFGLRNAGKSTLVNAFTGQDVAIVSDRPGTTTDPVSKAMEILPLGPCLVTDTAGLDDDEDSLGARRVAKSLETLAATDIAVWVSDPAAEETGKGSACRKLFLGECAKRRTHVVEYRRGDSMEALKDRIAALGEDMDKTRPLVSDLVESGDAVVCVCPIDSAAPKGRLILPQQQVIRELLDSGATAIVCRETELEGALSRLASPPRFVITDSQAFAKVSSVVPESVPLTSFSIVFARAKGDLGVFCSGVKALASLKDGDCVLISEGCTHRRQCGDIGTVKLPKWLERFSGAKLEFEWTSGGSFPEDLSRYAAVVHCGGCMLARRVVQNRIARCVAQNKPVVNYGVAIAACNGITADPGGCMVKRGKQPGF